MKKDPGPDPESDSRNEPALKYQYLIYDAWHDDRKPDSTVFGISWDPNEE